MPKKTKEAIVKDIIKNLPKRQWLVSDFDLIINIFMKKVTKNQIETMDSLIETKFKTRREARRFLNLFFNEVIVTSKQNHEYWQNLILEEEDDKKMHIYNEISLSLKEMEKIAYSHTRKYQEKKTRKIIKYMILQFLRVTKILYLLQNNKTTTAIKNAKFLRAERFEMKQDA